MAQKRFTFRLRELHALHASLRVVFVLILILTASLLAYMAVRIFALRDVTTFGELFSLCFFAVACLVLCIAQLQCLRRMRQDTREKIETMTFVDELTGVCNSRYLEQRLNEELQRARRHNCPLALILFDVDHFKMVNDSFGHEAGNTVLRRVSQTARGAARGEDFVGRLGGDEFLVVLPHTDRDDALIAAERIKRNLDAMDLVASTGQRIDFLTYSLGVGSYPGNGQTREELVQAADEAMHRAKKSGGDRVSI